jgi:DNA-binding MarR family transcriptional regulator
MYEQEYTHNIVIVLWLNLDPTIGRMDELMVKKHWTFLSNHGRVFIYLAGHPGITTQSLAYKTGLSIRAVQMILDDLEAGGYLSREKIGRNNRYEIHSERSLRHRLEKHRTVGDVFLALGTKTRKNVTSLEKGGDNIEEQGESQIERNDSRIIKILK